MSRPKHTPGPWEIEERNTTTFFINAPNGDPNLGYAKWDGLAETYGSTDEPAKGRKVARANARLIAAAPALLEALEKAVADYGKPGGPWNVPSEPGTWIVMARNAIARAKGEAE